MTNLPTSDQTGNLDNLSVTRAEFRAEIGVLLEYIAQALGDVAGNYTTETVNPRNVVLQGAPKIEIGATPSDSNSNERIPSTDWVKKVGRYVGGNPPAGPKDGMLWIDNSSNPYQLKAFNSGNAGWDIFSGFPSGTRMLFQQSAAPIGWTKITKYDNTALRLVGGNVTANVSDQDFTVVFAKRTFTGTVGDTSLTVAQMPKHSHPVTDPGHNHSLTFSPIKDGGPIIAGRDGPGHWMGSGGGVSSAKSNVTIASNGAGKTHDHSFTAAKEDFSVNYVDVIIAKRD